MRFCTNCGEGIDDNVQICPKCGTPVSGAAPKAVEGAPNNAQGQPAQPGQPTQQGQPGPQQFQPYQAGPGGYQQPMYMYDPTDHTPEMDPNDIADNKILAIAIYLFGWIGMIVALLAAKESKFVGFHLRQVIKYEVLCLLIEIFMAFLCWTIIVPAVGAVCILVLLVVKIIGFVNTCNGKAKELPIVNAFKFL